MVRALLVLASAAALENTIEIAPGVDMPVVSFGICNHTQFIEMGGRGMDSAFSYGDDSQREVAESIHKSGIDRSEFFVITKVPCCPANQFWGVGVQGCGDAPRDIAADLQHDMDMLGLEYVDLMMMHWACDSMEDTVRAYQHMEAFMKAGKARALGVSNFNSEMLQQLLKRASVKPVVNQVGFSVGNHAPRSAALPSKQHWGSDDETYSTCRDLGITLQAFSPLGGHGQYDVLHDPTVQAVAAETGRSTAQVALRWLAQRGMALVTAAEKPAYIQQDMAIFEFELSEDQMQRLTAVNSDTSVLV